MLRKVFTLFIFFNLLIYFFTSCSLKRSPGKKISWKGLENVQRTDEGENTFVCSFDGIEHDFILDMPEASEKALPLVLLLHGYSNTASFMRETVFFHREALPRGYACLYVSGSISKYEKTGGLGWNSGIAEKGNDDVAFLLALVKYLQKEYGFDKERTYVAGFSNGGFMAHRLAMEGGDCFAACVSVAGKMPERIWKNRNKKNKVGFFQITGEKDDVVPKRSDGSYKYTKDPAIEDVMEYWASSNGLENMTRQEIGQGSLLTRWCAGEIDAGRAGGQEASVQVWHLFVKDSHHYWPDQQINHINGNSLILDFFDANSK